MLLFDFRQQKTVAAYRGFTGGIRQVSCQPNNPTVVSIGLDRFIRVHHINEKTPIYKSYLKSRLNAVLLRKDFSVDQLDEPTAEKEAAKSTGCDVLWSNMEVICEDKAKKGRKRKA